MVDEYVESGRPVLEARLTRLGNRRPTADHPARPHRDGVNAVTDHRLRDAARRRNPWINEHNLSKTAHEIQ